MKTVRGEAETYDRFGITLLGFLTPLGPKEKWKVQATEILYYKVHWFDRFSGEDSCTWGVPCEDRSSRVEKPNYCTKMTKQNPAIYSQTH